MATSQDELLWTVSSSPSLKRCKMNKPSEYDESTVTFFHSFHIIMTETSKFLACWCPPFYLLVPTVVAPEPCRMGPDTDGWRKKGKKDGRTGGGQGIKENTEGGDQTGHLRLSQWCKRVNKFSLCDATTARTDRDVHMNTYQTYQKQCVHTRDLCKQRND